MNKNYMSSDNYKRPKNTITDMVQNQEDIEELLKDYEEVDPENVSFIPLNTPIRYLIYDKNKKKELFRYGGTLQMIHEQYLVVAGKEKKTFSVQRYVRNSKGMIIYKTRIFQKIDKMKYALEQSTEIIKEQYHLINEQKNELELIKKKIKFIEKNIK